MAKKQQKTRALLVDDNYEFHVVLQATLDKDIAIDYAPDGFSALQMVKKAKYDIVLCDIYMPFLSGLALLAEFRKKNIQLPFLFMTGNVSDDVIREAFHLGAYNIVEKPFNKEELLSKIRKALELHATEEVTEISEQDRAYIYNTLKTYYYDIDKILRSIQHANIPVSVIHAELEKKIQTGKCLFDDLQNLKFFRSAS